MTTISLSAANTLPNDGPDGCLVGRIWLPGADGGPTPVLIRNGGVHDLTGVSPTLAGLLALDDPAAAARAGGGERLGDVEAILANSAHQSLDVNQPYFLAPADLQALKACGVTFVRSMLERVIEEKAKGDPDQAAEIRVVIGDEIGESLADVVPGSDEAARIKAVLTERGMWSQYLEVGIGPDAEVFTKAQPMAAVGTGAEIGIHPKSTWNNPEPEVVLSIAPSGKIVGACLGNDVNLRDFEGRSALLLGKAKDNRASCAVGPFIRLFDDGFNLDHVRAMEISLTVQGTDRDQPRFGRSGGLCPRPPQSIPRWPVAVHRHPVRTDRRPGQPWPGFYPSSGRYRHHRQSHAGQPDQPGQPYGQDPALDLWHRRPDG